MNKKELLQLDLFELDKKIQIQGTRFDRKRKVDDKIKARMEKMYWEKGMSYKDIADSFGVDPRTVRYNIDEEYRRNVLDSSPKRERSGKMNITPEDRALYKQRLVRAGAKVIVK